MVVVVTREIITIRNDTEFTMQPNIYDFKSLDKYAQLVFLGREVVLLDRS